MNVQPIRSSDVFFVSEVICLHSMTRPILKYALVLIHNIARRYNRQHYAKENITRPYRLNVHQPTRHVAFLFMLSLSPKLFYADLMTRPLLKYALVWPLGLLKIWNSAVVLSE